jgi:hypothetical protein
MLLTSNAGSAHHSYADFDRDHAITITGKVTEIFWGNPHILLTVDDNSEDMRIEWITTAGADKTGVASSQIEVGDTLTVTGSRHLDPRNHTMTMVQELRIAEKNWLWISPPLKGKRQ